jgi:pimeloyl-ACP methyl ester carboxylesterase
MPSPIKGILDRFRLRPKQYGRRPPLVLLNGLAEQPESWYRNRRFWARFFDVHAPGILVYEGDALHARIASKQPISVEYLVEELHTYLNRYVQNPPYHLVSSSLGGKIAVEFAAKYPHLVGRMILLCPSGMGDTERLPIMEGVRAQDAQGMVKSVFHRPQVADRDMLRYYKSKFQSKKWQKGMIRTVKGSLDHVVRDRLKEVRCPTLVITGTEDQVCDPKTAEEAAKDLPNGHFYAIPKCGHAPQIEKHRLVNRMVLYFLHSSRPVVRASWFRRLIVV